MKKKIYITGSSGFVGNYLTYYFGNKYDITLFKRNSHYLFSGEVVIHLAGKAHDLNNVENPFEYYEINTNLTKKIFDQFINSNSTIFITLSSVKAAADKLDSVLTEEHHPNPITHYGKSKLLAEKYIFSKTLPAGKRVYILRPCMIHGPGNKGNLNLLYKFVCKGFPWPLGAFENKRSYCSIDNLCFIIDELVNNNAIPSGVYNVADNESIATNDLIKLIAESKGKKPLIWNISRSIIKFLSKLGDFFCLPLNSERLNKLTESYIVSNNKIITAINKPLPLSTKEGLMKTLNSFNSNVK